MISNDEYVRRNGKEVERIARLCPRTHGGTEEKTRNISLRAVVATTEI
jgi:hypothetical protein